MFQIVGALCVLGAVAATDLSEYQSDHEIKKPIIPILKQSFDQHHEGYQYSYETANGIQAHEIGYFKNKGDKKNEILVQKGTFTYHDEHGHPITLTYIADEHGFQPQGAHLPTPPPIPEEIQKSLDEVYQHEELEHEIPQEEFPAEAHIQEYE